MDTDYSLVAYEKYTPDVLNFSDYSGRIRHLVEASVASKTRRAYTSCLKRFASWCSEKGLSSSATITQTMATISLSQLVKKVLRGFRREYGTAHKKHERLTSQSVRLIVKHTAAKAGLSLDLTAHSLRSVFVTTAICQGKTERSIMNQTGHKSTRVLRKYFIREDAIEDNATDNII